MHRKQHGITLVEVIGAIAIASIMLLGISTAMDNVVEDSKGQQASLYQSQVTAAARKYMAANYAQLVTDTASGATVAVPVAALQTGSFLSGSFASANAYGQVACILVRKNASASPPAKLDAMVVTYGGQAMPEKDIPQVALNAGVEGGYISKRSPAMAQGAAWQIDTTPYRGVACGSGAAVLSGNAVDGGHLASALFYDGPGQLSTDFVYRDAVPGHPELNQMNTPLLMAQDALVTKGAECGSSPALAIDSTSRGMLVCGADGLWKDAAPSSWKDPVANYTDLPASGNQRGDVRIVTGLSRAFSYDGSNWVALAVDQNGNLSVPGSLTVGQNVTAQNNITAGNTVQANSVYGVTSVRGGYLKSDNFTETGEINLFHYKHAGDACNIPVVDNGVAVHVWPIGTVLLDGNALPLICANDGIFRYANGQLTP